MSDLETFEHTEQPVSPQERDKSQYDLESVREWSDDSRREAVRQNRLESSSEPLDYEDGLHYLEEYEGNFIDAALESEQDDEKRKVWQTTAEKMSLDFKLARFNSPQPVMRLINEVESHLESLAHMKAEGEGDATIHESEMQDLRRVRNTLFTRYEQMPPSELAEPTQSFESVYGGLTGHAPAPHLRNEVKKRDNAPEEELSSEKPQLGEVLTWTDQALGSNEVTQRFQEAFGETHAISSGVASRMAEELFSLYQRHTDDQLSSLEYADRINNLFKRYQEELESQQAA